MNTGRKEGHFAPKNLVHLWQYPFVYKFCYLQKKTSLYKDDYAKDGGEEGFTNMHCIRITEINDSIGIRLKNAMHLGKSSSPPSILNNRILNRTLGSNCL